MKKLYFVMVALIVASMILAACGPAETPAPVATEAPTEVMTAEPTEAPTEVMTEAPTEAAAAFKVGQVTDLGGIDDKSFHATAYAGIEQAVD